MSKPLPARPDLEQLRKQAKDLLKSKKSGHSDALKRIRESHPRFATASESEIRAAKFSLHDAQLALAREYGFASWPRLKAHVVSILLETGDAMELFKKAFEEHPDRYDGYWILRGERFSGAKVLVAGRWRCFWRKVCNLPLGLAASKSGGRSLKT